MASQRPTRVTKSSTKLREEKEAQTVLEEELEPAAKRPRGRGGNKDKTTNNLLEKLIIGLETHVREVERLSMEVRDIKTGVNDVAINFRDLAARVSVVEDREVSSTPPTYADKGKAREQPPPVTDAIPCNFVDPVMRLKVLRGDFNIWQSWQLDEERCSKLAPADGPEDDAALLRRYPNVWCLLRPWAVYLQLREEVEPGSATTLTYHTRHIYYLHGRYSNAYIGIMAYHFLTVNKRIMGRYPRSTWKELDSEVFKSALLPYLRPADLFPQYTLPADDATGHCVYNESAPGSTTSQIWCDEYTELRGCLYVPCRRRHGCLKCGPDITHSVNGSCPFKPKDGPLITYDSLFYPLTLEDQRFIAQADSSMGQKMGRAGADHPVEWFRYPWVQLGIDPTLLLAQPVPGHGP